MKPVKWRGKRDKPALPTLREYEARIFERINPAVRFSVTRYVLTIALFAAVVIFGIISIGGPGVDMLPSVSIPVVSISTSYSGASPKIVDEEVTKVIESAVSTLPGIQDINSSSNSGNSNVRLTFLESVDRNAAVNQVAAVVSSVARRLPSGAGTPSVQTFDPNSGSVLQFGISGNGAPMEEIAYWAENTLQPQLQRIEGIANIQVEGGPSRQFVVYLNPDRLQYYRLNPSQVTSALSAVAVNQPIGTISTDQGSLTYTSRNQFRNLAEIEQTMVDQNQGVRLRDLATIRDIPVAGGIARVNGQPAVLLSIQRTGESNAVAVVDGVTGMIEGMTLPDGYTITQSNDTTVAIRASVESTFHELLVTACVVAIICLLFLGKLNTAFAVILAIPISLMAAPILYNLLGFSFNLISLLALIVAIGIVVDDSIVIAENVERYKKMGYGNKEAVLKGASEVFSAVVAATLSLLAVLIPVSFIGGFVGRYLQQFSLGLSAAVFFSLVEAVLFLTVRLAYTKDPVPRTWKDFGKSLTGVQASVKWGFKAFRHPAGIIAGLAGTGALIYFGLYPWLFSVVLYPILLAILHYLVLIVLSLLEAVTGTLHGWTEAMMDRVTRGYARLLQRVLKRSGVVLSFTVVGLGAILYFVAPHIPFNFVPQSDSGTMNIGLRMPQGTASNVTNTVAHRLEQYLMNREEIESVQVTIGGGTQASFANFLVQLIPVEERPPMDEMIQTMRTEMQALVQDHPSARISMGGGGGFQGQGSGISFSIQASRYEELLERNEHIVRLLQNNPYIADVGSSLSNTTLENVFRPDPEKLKGTGVSAGTVTQTLQIYTSGSQAASVQIEGASYPIQVRIDPAYLTGTQSLLDLTVYSSSLQTNLKIGQLGAFEVAQAPQSLNRYNRLYSASFNANLNPGAPAQAEFLRQITTELTDAGLIGNGVDISSGSRFSIARLSQQLSTDSIPIFGIALLLAYLVMAAQFNSWRYPIYLLLPVPLAIIGALLLVYITDSGLDVFGIMGMLMLIGLSAKNAIIYLDFVVERIKRIPLEDALIDAARLRFRPIVMTTLTILVISFPLVFTQGQGSEFGRKLGVVMLGGILSSAILTFFVVPAAFYRFERKRIGTVAEPTAIEDQRPSEVPQDIPISGK